MIRFSRYQPERQLLGGICTHQSKAPFHGARNSNYGHVLESALEEGQPVLLCCPVTICARYLSASGSFISIVQAHLAVRATVVIAQILEQKSLMPVFGCNGKQ